MKPEISWPRGLPPRTPAAQRGGDRAGREGGGRAGIDVLMAYNTGPFRMDGHGSLAGYLAYGDSNAITLDLARRILPLVQEHPVVAGVGAADPYRDVSRLVDELLSLGYSGITANVPPPGSTTANSGSISTPPTWATRERWT